jgi:hypothetical protein
MTHAVSKAFRFIAAFATLFAPSLWAQGPAPDAPAPVPAATAPIASGFVQTTNPFPQHKFWDAENSILFATSAAMNTADFWVTRANLQSGGQELNPLVRVFGKSTAGLAANFAGETAGVVGMSYFFHRTGHHRMERMVSMVNIGGSIGAVSYGLTHQSGPPAAGDHAARSDRGITIKLKISSR